MHTNWMELTPPSSTEVKNDTWNYTFTPSLRPGKRLINGFVKASYLSKHRDNFTFTFNLLNIRTVQLQVLKNYTS
jgi:hypothetical protein